MMIKKLSYIFCIQNKKSGKNTIEKVEREGTQMQKEKAITLVALIISVVVMLILAGVAIRLSIGENGIFQKTQDATIIYEEQQAREKLELALNKLGLSKYMDSNYNEKEYIDKELAKQDIVVVEHIAIVDNWLFELDRSVPKIGKSLGKGKENEDIKITISPPTISSDYETANVQVQIQYEGKIAEIILKGEKQEIPIAVNGVYTIQKEVKENGNYTIIVKDENGNFKIEKVEISELTQDMDIWNKQDMELFRDKVNEGRTFANRTVRIMDNIDLEGQEKNQWNPIGTKEHPFKGTLEGNGHTIENMYLTKADCKTSALFGEIEEATIQNVSVTGTVETMNYGAGIVAYMRKACTIYNCKNYVNVTHKGNSYTVAGYPEGDVATVAGIAGFSYENCKFEKCINYGTMVSNIAVGGIVGTTNRNIIIDSCGNEGEITGRYQHRRNNSSYRK